MIVNGAELDFNYSNPDHLERFQKAYEKCQSGYKEAQDMASNGDVVRAMKKYISDTRLLFDETCGEGTASRVLGESNDTVEHINAVTEFADGVYDKMIENNEKVAKSAQRAAEKIARFQHQK